MLKMDPYRGGIAQKLLTGVLFAFLTAAYWVLKFILRNVKEEIKEPPHLLMPPTKPIPSLKLATALNPKTPVNKLQAFVSDEDPYVRRAVVRNPALPVEEIKKLESDPVAMVAEEAKRAFFLRMNFDPDGYELSPI